MELEPSFAKWLCKLLLKLDTWCHKTIDRLLIYIGEGVHPKERLIDFAQFVNTEAKGKDRVVEVTAQSTFTEHFDVAVVSNVLEHIEQRPAFLESVARWAPKLLIRVPMTNQDWRAALKKEWNLARDTSQAPRTEYTEEQFRNEMTAAHLTIQKMIFGWGEIWAVVIPSVTSDLSKYSLTRQSLL